MRLKKALLNQAGDTIVEVMIVLSILGLAMGTAYATANRSLLNARQAQESSIATGIAQSQIEQIRQLAGEPESSPNNVFMDTAPYRFCITETGTVQDTGFLGNDPTLLSDYPANCRMGDDDLYHVSVQYENPDPVRPHNFVVRVVWEDVAGNGTDSVTMTYRIHPLEYTPPATPPASSMSAGATGSTGGTTGGGSTGGSTSGGTTGTPPSSSGGVFTCPAGGRLGSGEACIPGQQISQSDCPSGTTLRTDSQGRPGCF